MDNQSFDNKKETDEHVSDLASILSEVGINDDVCETLRTIKSEITPLFSEGVSKVYERIDKTPCLNRFFKDQGHKEKTAGEQKQHWSRILDGDFNKEYVKKTQEIGRIHSQIGLEPQWYMSSYGIIFDQIFRGIIQNAIHDGENHGTRGQITYDDLKDILHQVEEKTLAVHKAYMLDMDLSLTAYFWDNVRRDKEAFQEISKSFDDIASGNLNIKLQENVVGRSSELYKSFESLRVGLSELIKNIKNMSLKVKESSQHVETQARSIEGKNHQQSSSVEHIQKGMNLLNESMGSIAEQIHNLDAKMQECQSFVASGNEDMSVMRATMGEIRKAWDSVTNLTSDISSIAAQTNFLALNASVEAARAGDTGKGFAVVATAIRELSQKTTATAEDIAKSTSKSSELINNGTQRMEKTLDAFGRAGEQIKAVSPISNNISKELTEKKDDISSITKQCATLVEVVEGTNKSVQEGRENATSLNALVQQLDQQTRKFRN